MAKKKHNFGISSKTVILLYRNIDKILNIIKYNTQLCSGVCIEFSSALDVRIMPTKEKTLEETFSCKLQAPHHTSLCLETIFIKTFHNRKGSEHFTERNGVFLK